MINRILTTDAPVLVGFSGGKDSIAMVLMLLQAGVPRHRIILHHHDVDGDGESLFDWACTKSYCQAFADAFGLQLLFSYRKGGIVREIYRYNEARQDVYYQVRAGGPFRMAPSIKTAVNTRGKFPAVSANLMTRWCSSTVKIDVFKTAVAHNPDYKVPLIFILTGERRQESSARAKYNEVEVHNTSRQHREAVAWRPIIDWSEDQVWAIMQRYGVQPHPAYMLGWSRCSCQTCIFGSANIWASINQISPEKVQTLSDIEDSIGFTMYSQETIFDKVYKGQAFDNMDPYWVEQATGTFTAPILINSINWTVPAGAYSYEAAGSN